MDYFARLAAAVTLLSGVVALVSKFAAWREERLRERTIRDLKSWMETDDAQFFITGKLKEWRYHERHKEIGA